MSKIPKQKKSQLILVGLVTLMTVAALWYTLIRYQQAQLTKLQTQREKARKQSELIQETIRNSSKTEAELVVVSNKLATEEADMASGDLYSSMFNLIRNFKAPYRVDIPQFTSVGTPAEMNLLPKFPYKQVSMSVSGTAFYYDLGRFIADFENRFPYCRVLNLELMPASAVKPEEKEKLAFRMDVVSLVKPEKPEKPRMTAP